jgi:hypothetical protein
VGDACNASLRSGDEKYDVIYWNAWETHAMRLYVAVMIEMTLLFQAAFQKKLIIFRNRFGEMKF